MLPNTSVRRLEADPGIVPFAISFFNFLQTSARYRVNANLSSSRPPSRCSAAAVAAIMVIIRFEMIGSAIECSRYGRLTHPIPVTPAPGVLRRLYAIIMTVTLLATSNVPTEAAIKPDQREPSLSGS